VAVAECENLTAAREAAAQFKRRCDLRYQDVVIRDVSGKRIEYAGPSR
jgi:hypothetical protein